MGVDHTAFACYGIRCEIQDWPSLDLDDINEQLPDGLEIYEWGGRCYGGSWGLILALKETYAEVDFDDWPGVRALPYEPDSSRVRAIGRLYEGQDVLKCKFTGEPGWFVGGRTW